MIIVLICESYKAALVLSNQSVFFSVKQELLEQLCLDVTSFILIVVYQ